MSQDIDRLIDSAFEHDRTRLPKGATSAPASLVSKASVPVSASGVLSAAWFKLALGILAIGGVTTYFVLYGTQSPTPTAPSATTTLPALDSPVVIRDSIVPPSRRVQRPVGVTASPSTSQSSQPPRLMPPILDSGVKLADSIRSRRRPR